MKTAIRAILRTTLGSSLALACCLPAHSQCDWQQQIVSAVKNRLPGEQACRVLTGPPEPMFGALDAIEADLLARHTPIAPEDRESWKYQEWLNSYARRFRALSGNSPNEGASQRVIIARNDVPDAYATGHYIVLASGLVDWFTHPELALEDLGLTEQQAEDYLARVAPERSYSPSNPGPDGLIAIAALESAHNLLGHTSAFPIAQACDGYIESQRRELYEYEKTIALGKKQSWFSAMFSSGPPYTPLPIDERQEQADADTLGNWISWEATSNGALLAAALRWLSLVPEQGSLPKAPKGQEPVRMQYISSMLCSDRNSLRSRADSLNGYGRWSSSLDPPSPRAAPPTGEAVARFQDFQAWFPTRRAEIDRIARGELHEEEKSREVNVELEAKPGKATLLVDGKALSRRKVKTALTIGPHVIASSCNGITREQRIVVFEDGPTKFKVEAK